MPPAKGGGMEIIMIKEDRIKKLFAEIKVFKGKHNFTSEEIDEIALRQWKENHDYIPTLEEIDSIIEEVRNGR